MTTSSPPSVREQQALVFGHERLVQTGAQEAAFVDWVRRCGTVAVDTETTGLRWSDTPRLVVFANTTEAWCVPAENESLIGYALEQADMLVFHNAGYDIRMLNKIEGISVGWDRVWDTYILAHLHKSDQVLGLKPLMQKYLGQPPAEQDLLKRAMRKLKVDWATVPIDLPEYVDYACMDGVGTARLYEALTPLLDDDQLFIAEKEHHIARLCWEREQAGMLVDVEYALSLKAEWQARILELVDKMAKWGVVNPNANRDVERVLREQGWTPTLFTANGQAQLDREVLVVLAQEFELAEALIEYKRLAKWSTAYIDGVLDNLDDQNYVHASINGLKAKTGRMSISRPPLQQLPSSDSTIRSMFIAPPGQVIVSADFSQVEPRVAAALSQDQRMIQFLTQSEVKFHSLTARRLFGVDQESARQYSIGKAIGLGVLYAKGSKSIARETGVSDTIAEGLVEGFWSIYPDLRRWDRKNRSDAKKGRPVHSLWGRPLSPHAPYAATNAIVQGGAGEVFKDATFRLEEAGLLEYALLPIHDEWLFSVPTADPEGFLADVKQAMETTIRGVPIVVETEVYGSSWGEGYKNKG